MTGPIIHPTGRSPAERVWVELRHASGPLAPATLVVASGLAAPDARQIPALLGRWKAAGWIEQERAASGDWRLTPRGRAQRTAPDAPPPPPARLGHPGPRAFRGRGGTRDRLWQSMRMLVSFDAVELAMMSGAKTTVASTLIRDLKRVNLLRPAYEQPGRWQKARPFGVKPPAIARRLGQRGVELVVRDRNTGGESVAVLRPAGSAAAASLAGGGEG